MVDLKKYADIYEEIKDFYEVVGDFLLQQRQREVVSKNLF